MNWRLSGQDQTLMFFFRVDGQFAVPDDGSLKLTVRGSDGVALAGYDSAVQTDTALTQVQLVLPASINTIAGSADFEMRYARLAFTVDGKQYWTDENYRIHNFIPINAGEESVRALIGVEYEELPDTDIDLMGSYFFLTEKVGTALKAALFSSTTLNLHANTAISVHAALQVFPSLQSRILKEEKQDNAAFTRLPIDFEDLNLSLELKLQEALTAISEAETGVVTAAVVPSLFVVVTPTDAITGA